MVQAVQTGFYVAQKKYIAGAGDYKAKPGSYWEYVDIRKVDAKCMVFEIPVSLRYDFSQKKSHSWFVLGGLSSYIMKSEEYHYDYMRYGIRYYDYRDYTGNKHLFSVLNLSVGLDKKIANRFSFVVNPYVSLPVTGVGEGRIKLFSAGIQAGLKFMPSGGKK
jgi:hypothetical protein